MGPTGGGRGDLVGQWRQSPLGRAGKKPSLSQLRSALYFLLSGTATAGNIRQLGKTSLAHESSLLIMSSSDAKLTGPRGRRPFDPVVKPDCNDTSEGSVQRWTGVGGMSRLW